MSNFSDLLGVSRAPLTVLGSTQLLSTARVSGAYEYFTGASDKPGAYAGVLFVDKTDTFLFQLAFERTTNYMYKRVSADLATPTFSPWLRMQDNYPVQYISTATGVMSDAALGGVGGLNSVNVWSYAGLMQKQIPQSPSNGDECVIIVTNGRLDNQLLVGAAAKPIHGITDYIVLDTPGPFKFKYLSTLNEWRITS